MACFRKTNSKANIKHFTQFPLNLHSSITLSTRYATRFSRIHRKANKKMLQQAEQEYDERIAREMSELKELDLAPQLATDFENAPLPVYESIDDGKEPFVKPLNSPYPQGVFNEVRPEPLLIWNDFQERYELRDKTILSERTKQIILSMNRRRPTIWTKKSLSKKLGLSEETIDFIFWEDGMRRKYKLRHDLDTIKLLEAYCKVDDNESISTKTYTMMAYSNVSGDPFFLSGNRNNASPLVVNEDDMDNELYMWQQKQNFKRKLDKDQYELVPSNGSGSGKSLNNEYPKILDLKQSYLVVDVGDDEIGALHTGKELMSVKVRETNGTMRWGTLEEVNHVREREYPTEKTAFGRIRQYSRARKHKPMRKFPKRPYLDRGYVNHYWEAK